MKTLVLKKGSCEELADQLHNNYFFDEIVDECFWNRNFSSDRFFDALKAAAAEAELVLADAETWDYETYFWNLYECSEKGLS